MVYKGIGSMLKSKKMSNIQRGKSWLWRGRGNLGVAAGMPGCGWGGKDLGEVQPL